LVLSQQPTKRLILRHQPLSRKFIPQAEEDLETWLRTLIQRMLDVRKTLLRKFHFVIRDRHKPSVQPRLTTHRIAHPDVNPSPTPTLAVVVQPTSSDQVKMILLLQRETMRSGRVLLKKVGRRGRRGSLKRGRTGC
jgi:hypothetical protein